VPIGGMELEDLEMGHTLKALELLAGEAVERAVRAAEAAVETKTFLGWDRATTALKEASRACRRVGWRVQAEDEKERQAHLCGSLPDAGESEEPGETASE
jgi:hypothetical protein